VTPFAPCLRPKQYTLKRFVGDSNSSRTWPKPASRPSACHREESRENHWSGARDPRTPGKILVIDFFGTWCPPCLAELPEIARVRADLQVRRDIEFVVVGTNPGGDTPECLRSFGQLRHVTLPLAFDQGGKAHKAFGLGEFPGMVVLDRNGRVRLTREGYNSSEATFRSNLTQLLKSL
jgi:thiol-disulfide isomerase/thioredoxin